MTDLYDYHNGPNLGLEPTTPRQVTYQNGWPVPKGWKLVPEEPTQEMLDVLTKAAAQTESWRYGYYNMLAAAPTPPAATAAPSDEHVSVVGMPEFDALLDHIYEYGTASEGIIDRANAFARALLARYGQPAAQPKRRPYNASGSLSEYGVFPECDAAPVAQDPAKGVDVALRYNWNEHLIEHNAPEYQHDFILFKVVEAYVLKHLADRQQRGGDVVSAIDAAMREEGRGDE